MMSTSVWSPSSGNFSNLHYKTLWWEKKKKHLLCPDYRLLQPNEQTFVLSTSPVWTTSSWLWCYLNFTACYFLCQKVTLKSLIKREKSCSQGILLATGSEVRTISPHHLGFKKPAEEHFCMSSSSPFFSPTFVPSSSTSHKRPKKLDLT